MENALATTGGVPAAPASARFANPLTQVSGMLKQPAVKRSLPMIFMVGLILSAAIAWMALASPPQRVLFPQLPDSDKQAVVDALGAAKIDSSVDDSGGITVAEDDYHRARILLAGQDLPKAAPGGYAILDQLPMGVSRAVEGERLRQARETELAKSIAEIESVVDARVHLAMPESSVFVLLKMLRDSGVPQKVAADHGQFQQTLPQGRTFQLLRLRIDPGLQLIPEISGNRLIVSVRLMRQDEAGRLQSSTEDAAFELTLCA